MAITINKNLIQIDDKNGSTRLVASLSFALFSVFLPIGLAFVEDITIPLILLGVFCFLAGIWLLFWAYYKIITDIDKSSQTITISKKRIGQSLKIERTLKFQEIMNVSYMNQLNGDVSGNFSFIYLFTKSEPKKRIKLISSPLGPTIGQKDDYGDVLEDAQILADFIGVPFEKLTGFQPLDS